MSTNDFDFTKEPTKQELQTWYDGLSDSDKQVAQQQRMWNAFVNKKSDKETDLSRLSDGDFRKYLLSLGIG